MAKDDPDRSSFIDYIHYLRGQFRAGDTFRTIDHMASLPKGFHQPSVKVTISHLIVAGLLSRVGRGVYRVQPDLIDPPEERVLARYRECRHQLRSAAQGVVEDASKRRRRTATPRAETVEIEPLDFIRQIGLRSALDLIYILAEETYGRRQHEGQNLSEEVARQQAELVHLQGQRERAVAELREARETIIALQSELARTRVSPSIHERVSLPAYRGGSGESNGRVSVPKRPTARRSSEEEPE